MAPSATPPVITQDSGTVRMSPPSGSAGDAPTTRVTFGTPSADWDAIAKSFTQSMWGGTQFAANQGNPQSWFTAPPSYLTNYATSVQRSAQGTIDAQKSLMDQNSAAFRAIVESGAQANSLFGRPFPMVIDPTSAAFRLQPPPQAARSSRGLAGIPTWAVVAAAVAGVLIWKKTRKRAASST